MKDTVRDKLQQKWLSAFISTPKQRGTLEAVTGSGKSMLGKLLIEKINKIDSSLKSLIIVPKTHLKEQWKTDYVDKFNLLNVDILVVNTAIKSDLSTYSFVVLDEIHRYAAPKFKKIFTMINQNIPMLGLTGTFERSDDGHKYISLFCPVFSSYTYEEALKDKVISDFDIINIPVEFDQKNKIQYNKANTTFNYYFSFFNRSFDNVRRTMSNDYTVINSLCLQYGINEQELKKNAVQFYRSVQKRKELIYRSEEKIRIAKRLINNIEKKKIITFSASIESAEELRNECGGLVYHSKLSLAKRKAIIEEFKNSAMLLHSVNALDEGLDVPNIDLAINVNGNSTHIQSAQRLGRAARKSSSKSFSYFINIFLKNTQDEKWTKNKQLRLPNVYTTTVENTINAINNA